MNTILCYVTKDLAAAEEKFGKDAMAAEVLATLRVSEQVKRCQDPAELLGLVRQHRSVGPRAMGDCLMAKEIGSAVSTLLEIEAVATLRKLVSDAYTPTIHFSLVAISSPLYYII